jgi:hypothetical protein
MYLKNKKLVIKNMLTFIETIDVACVYFFQQFVQN